MTTVDTARCTVDAVALFRDRDRHDPGFRRQQRIKHRLPLGLETKRPGQGTDHAGLASGGTALDHGVKPVLRRQFLGGRLAAQADTDNAPVTTRGRQGIIGHDRLVGLVERAEADMHDTGAMLLPAVPGTPDVIRQALGRGQPVRHSAGIPCCSPAITPRSSASPFNRPIDG